MEFVYGKKERMFINTEIGCRAKCSYCYLPNLQQHQKRIDSISSHDACGFVERNPLFHRGEDGTILSIGCYSECFTETNILKTKEIIEQLMPYGNYIQLATKQEVPQSIIDAIIHHRRFEQQVIIYISIPTISAKDQLEEGTSPIRIRIRNIKRCVLNDIPVVLYIKPFIEGVTNKDIRLFMDISRNNNISVVIGERLTVMSMKNPMSASEVGEGKLSNCNNNLLYNRFINSFSKYCRCYKHSTDIIEYYRSMRKNYNDRGMDQ